MFSSVSLILLIVVSLSVVLDLIKAIKLTRLMTNKRFAHTILGEFDNSFDELDITYSYCGASRQIKLSITTAGVKKSDSFLKAEKTESHVVIGSFAAFADEKYHLNKFKNCSSNLEKIK
jgi:hypothetical protein